GCDDRYARTTNLSFARGPSSPLPKPEFVAQLSGGEWGFQQHGNLVVDANVPGGTAMTVSLPSGAKKGGTPRTPGSGLGFDWNPRVLGDATSGCLSYEVFLPRDWSYNASGILPGLYGGPKGFSSTSNVPGTFEARVGWSFGPRLGVNIYRGGEGGKARVGTQPARYHVPQGRWVQIMQEIKLNDPGQANGLLRLWVDGEIRIDIPSVRYYAGKQQPRILGVVGDTHYGDPRSAWRSAPKPSAIKLSPFKLYWN
ncbi:MAG: polysaccharide lyase, partial [Pseudomonadota bacterium]